MRKLYPVLLLAVLFVHSTGAAIIDQETKKGVINLNNRFDSLSQQVQYHHAAQMKLLKEDHEAIQNLIQRVERLEKTGVKPSAGMVTPAPVPSSEAVSPPPVVVAAPPPVVPEVAKVSPAVAPPPAPVAQPDMEAAQLGVPFRQNPPIKIFTFVLMGLLLCGVVVARVQVRREENQKKRLLWRSEIDSLKDAVNRGRPHLKILAEGERATLVNTGESTADDIRLHAGPTPTTMRHKVRTVTRMLPGERFEVNLYSSAGEGSIYANLEYKNLQTGKVYKEQFVMETDRATGRLVPVPQQEAVAS